MPPLPGSAAKTGAAPLDGPTLFNQFECSRCHGTVGEGGVGPALNQTEWTPEQLTDIIRNGKDSMKGYPAATMTDEEMNALIPYVQAIGRGEVQSAVILYKRQLPPPQLGCEPACGVYADGLWGQLRSVEPCRFPVAIF